MEKVYTIKTKEEEKNLRKIFSVFMIFLTFFYIGFFEVIEYFDYSEQLGLERTLPGVALGLGELVLVILIIVLSYFVIFAFLSILDSIIPTLRTRKEVLEKIKGNEEKISDLIKKNKDLNNLIK